MKKQLKRDNTVPNGRNGEHMGLLILVSVKGSKKERDSILGVP